jgi:hypothetical protein
MATVTATALVTDALQMLQVYPSDQPLTDADLEKGLEVLNDMMDLWSNESLTCFTWLTQTFTLIPGQSAYTVGTGGYITGGRPLRVSDAPGAAYLLDSNQNRYLMNVDDQLAWNTITTAVASSDLPDHLFYDPQYPLGIINIWPTPNVGYTCSFLSYAQLVEFSSPSAVLSLPPGYKRAITTNLACLLKPYFLDSQLDPDIRIMAGQSKATIKRTNMREQIAVFDPELVSRGNQVYNIYADRGSGRI